MSEDSEALTYCFNLSYFRTSDFHADAYVEISLPRMCLTTQPATHSLTSVEKNAPS